MDQEYIRRELENPVTAVQRFGNDFRSSEYHKLAGEIKIKSVMKDTSKTVKEYVERYGKNLREDMIDYMYNHEKQIQELWKELDEYNYRFYYCGIMSLLTSYSMKERFDSKPTESPVQIFTRSAIQIFHKDDWQDVADCARLLATGIITLATPAYVASCNKKNQTASCYISVVGDNIESIAKFIFEFPAIISSNGGGVGIDFSRIRHSEISTRGMSKGVIPLAKILNKIMEYADQRNTRKGAANICLACWHIDIFDFIKLTRKNNKSEDTVDEPFNMFTTVMYNNLFMKRAREGGNWTLFCPSKVPKLLGKFGKEFIDIYEEYERDESIPSHAKRVVKASDLASAHYLNKLNAGGPYDVNLDAINMKNPLGDKYWINCPNLCLEVMQYADEDEVAVCNLGSISLPNIVGANTLDNTGVVGVNTINYNKLGASARNLVVYLNNLIDNTNNSIEHANRGARNRRSLGIGVQGFADMLYMLDLHFEHPEALVINKKISACIYWNALVRSLDLAIEKCSTFVGYEDSWYAKGYLQFDLWKREYDILDDMGMIDHNIRRRKDDEPVDPSTWGQKSYKLCNDEVVEPTWESLKEYIMKYGLYNAHVTTQQPTATTAVINNNIDMREAISNNIHTREMMKLDYTYINPHMERDLRDIGLWTHDVVSHIRENSGSLQGLTQLLDTIPEDKSDRLKYVIQKYKTMYELKTSLMFKFAADSGRYVCQSQSTNVYIKPNINIIKGIHHLGTAYGLKTTSYYTRINNEHTPSFFNKRNVICTDEICTSCSN